MAVDKQNPLIHQSIDKNSVKSHIRGVNCLGLIRQCVTAENILQNILSTGLKNCETLHNIISIYHHFRV